MANQKAPQNQRFPRAGGQPHPIFEKCLEVSSIWSAAVNDPVPLDPLVFPL